MARLGAASGLLRLLLPQIPAKEISVGQAQVTWCRGEGESGQPLWPCRDQKGSDPVLSMDPMAEDGHIQQLSLQREPSLSCLSASLYQTVYLLSLLPLLTVPAPPSPLPPLLSLCSDPEHQGARAVQASTSTSFYSWAGPGHLCGQSQRPQPLVSESSVPVPSTEVLGCLLGHCSLLIHSMGIDKNFK